MAFPVSGAGGNAEDVAAQIDGQVRAALAQALAWRTSVNATGNVNSGQAENVYQALLALRTYVTARGSVPGLAQAYERRFTTLTNFNPATEWAGASTAIADFASWLAANWPERTASNKPAFQQFAAGTGELENFTFSLSAPARASLISRLDAVLAAFTTP